MHRTSRGRPDEVQPDPPVAVLVMLAHDDDRVVVIDLATHPCGQHILDDYAVGARLVPAARLSTEPREVRAGHMRLV